MSHSILSVWCGRPWITWLLIILTACGPLDFAPAQQLDSSKESIEQARQLYAKGKLDDAIKLLNDCLEHGKPSNVEKGSAYSLLALCHLSKQATESYKEARNATLNLLKLDRNYTPPDEPLEFKNMVEEIRKELYPPEPSLVITEPVADTRWRSGSQHVVRWTASNVKGFLRFEMSTDGGQTFARIRDSVRVVESQLVVTAPVVAYSPSCILRASLVDQPGIVASSANFVVVGGETAEESFPPTWMWIGGGAVVAGVAAYLIFKKGEVSPPPPVPILPGPPSLPQ